MKFNIFLWKLGKGFFSGLSGSIAALTLTDVTHDQYWKALAGAAIAAFIHGGANAFDQMKPKGG